MDVEYDEDDLTFEEEPAKAPTQPAGPRKDKRKRIEGFYEEYTETEEDGKTVRRGKRSSYDHYDWRWKRARYEERIQNIFWFACGFFSFAIFRAVVLLG